MKTNNNWARRKAPVRSFLSSVLKRIFGGRPKGVGKPATVRALKSPAGLQAFALETLEPRLLLSGTPVTTFADGLLHAELTDFNDVASIEQTGTAADGGVLIDLTINSGATQSFGDADNGVLSIELLGLTGNDAISFLNVITVGTLIDGGDNDDTIFGPNVAGSWNLTGAGIGIVGSTAFASIESLVGGSAVDNFTFGLAGSLALGLDGGGDDNAILGPDADTDWVVTGADSGTIASATATDIFGATFSNIQILSGGTQDDTFVLDPGGALAQRVVGGGGRNALLAKDLTNSWVIHGADSGYLSDGQALLNFEGVGNLIGGKLNDTFYRARPGDGAQRGAPGRGDVQRASGGARPHGAGVRATGPSVYPGLARRCTHCGPVTPARQVGGIGTRGGVPARRSRGRPVLFWRRPCTHRHTALALAD